MNIFLQLHLMAIIPALLLGPFVLFRERGDRLHKVLGRIWAILMLVGCLLSFGVTYNGSYSWLHGLAIFTIYQIIRGLRAIRLKNLRVHKRAMVGSYLGSVAAFLSAAVLPNRIINNWIMNLLN
jgi:uncharacterized membrane protein